MIGDKEFTAETWKDNKKAERKKKMEDIASEVQQTW